MNDVNSLCAWFDSYTEIWKEKKHPPPKKSLSTPCTTLKSHFDLTMRMSQFIFEMVNL